MDQPQAQATLDGDPGVTRAAPALDVWPQSGTTSSSATIAPGRLPGLAPHQGSHWPGPQVQQQQLQQRRQEDSPEVWPKKDKHSNISQNSRRLHSTCQGAQQETRGSPAASVQQLLQEAASACHSNHSMVQQVPDQAQQTPPCMWQQVPGSAAQHLLSRSTHRSRSHGGQPNLNPGGPPYTHQNGSLNPSSVLQHPHLHKEQSAVDSPGASGAAPATQHWPTPYGAPPAWNHHQQQQQQQWQQRSASGCPQGTGPRERAQQQDGLPAWQQQQASIAHDSPGECSTVGQGDRNPGAPSWRQQQLGQGACDISAAHWQAQQRLRGQVHCPETPPSVRGPSGREGGSCSGMRGRPAGPVMSSFGVHCQQGSSANASSAGPHHPTGPEVASFSAPCQQCGSGTASVGALQRHGGATFAAPHQLGTNGLPSATAGSATATACHLNMSKIRDSDLEGGGSIPAELVWPGGKQVDHGGVAAAGTPLGDVLCLSHVLEWLRADVAEGVAFLQTAQMQVTCLFLNAADSLVVTDIIIALLASFCFFA